MYCMMVVVLLCVRTAVRTYCSVLYDGGSVAVCVDSCEDLLQCTV